MPLNELNIENKPESTLKNEPIVLVCAADDNYAMPLAVTARSVLVNITSQRKTILFVIDGGIKNHNKQKILNSLSLDNCEVRFIPKPSALLEDIEEVKNYCEANEKISALKHLSIASYYRLLIPEILPQNIEKVIYLDCDLVVNTNLEQLWQIDLGENLVLAVQDVLVRYVSTSQGLLNYKQLGISPDSKYFNAGVLAIDLKKWREYGITAKAIRYLKQNKDYIRLHDQDVLNALLADQWGELDPKWNLLLPHALAYSSWQESPFSENAYNSLIREPYIIHFATDRKPWNSRHALMKEHFFHYVDLTAWSGWRLTFARRLWIWLVREFRKMTGAK